MTTKRQTIKAPAKRRRTTRRPTRAYNTAFTPRGDGKEFKINRIPAGFWNEVRGKARREGVSLRGLVLTYLHGWLNEAA